MTAAELLAECHARNIILQALSDRLDIDAPAGELTDELLQALRTHKAGLLALLQPQDGDAAPVTDRPAGDSPQDSGPQGDHPQGDQGDHGDAGQDVDAAGFLEVTDPDGRRCWVRADVADLEIIDVPPPCPTCNGLDFWQDAAGGLHCSACSPRTPTGERLRRLAAELRRRHPVARTPDLQPRPVTVPRTWPATVTRCCGCWSLSNTTADCGLARGSPAGGQAGFR
jgi:hypothetical protein